MGRAHIKPLLWWTSHRIILSFYGELIKEYWHPFLIFSYLRIEKVNSIWKTISRNSSWECEEIIGFNGKHLSLEDRKIIENNIGKGLRKFEIAKELNKAQSNYWQRNKKQQKA